MQFSSLFTVVALATALASPLVSAQGGLSAQGGAVGDVQNQFTDFVASLEQQAGSVVPTKRSGSTLEGLTADQIQADLQQAVNGQMTPGRSLNGRGERPVRRTGDKSVSVSDNSGQCSVGKVQCCNSIVNKKEDKEQLAGLLGLDDVVGSIALNCNPINAIGAAVQSTCKTSPVCCNNVTQNGLINFGCVSLPIV